MVAMDAPASAARCLLAATIAPTPATVAPRLTTIAGPIGRSSIHRSSPSTALVGHARSCGGLLNSTGLSAIQIPTKAASRQLRRQTGTKRSGALTHLVHALHGLLCRANTARFIRRDPRDSRVCKAHLSVTTLTISSSLRSTALKLRESRGHCRGGAGTYRHTP